MADELERGSRAKLPSRRSGTTYLLLVRGSRAPFKCYVHLVCCDDGTLGDVRISTSKTGSDLRTTYEVWAETASCALQHGMPTSALAKVLRYVRDDNAGKVDLSDVPGIHGKHVLSGWDAIGMLIEAEVLGIKHEDDPDAG